MIVVGEFTTEIQGRLRNSSSQSMELCDVTTKVCFMSRWKESANQGDLWDLLEDAIFEPAQPSIH